MLKDVSIALVECLFTSSLLSLTLLRYPCNGQDTTGTPVPTSAPVPTARRIITDAPITTTTMGTTTTRRPRPTKPRPNFTIPTKKVRMFVFTFALFNCEKLKQCNVIPKEKACGRNFIDGQVLWFENICTLWKMNCINQDAYFFNQNIAMCEDFVAMHGANATIYTVTNYMLDKPYIRPPLGYNPYYTHDKQAN